MFFKETKNWLLSSPEADVVDIPAAKEKIKRLRKQSGLSRARLGARTGLGAFSVWMAELGVVSQTLYPRILQGFEEPCPRRQADARWKTFLFVPTAVMLSVVPVFVPFPMWSPVWTPFATFLTGCSSIRGDKRMRVAQTVFVVLCLLGFEAYVMRCRYTYDPSMAYTEDGVFLVMQAFEVSFLLSFVAGMAVAAGRIFSGWRRIGLFASGLAVFLLSGVPLPRVYWSLQDDMNRITQASDALNTRMRRARTLSDSDERLHDIITADVMYKKELKLPIHQWEVSEDGTHAYRKISDACDRGDQLSCATKKDLDKQQIMVPPDTVGHLMGVMFGLWGRKQ